MVAVLLQVLLWAVKRDIDFRETERTPHINLLSQEKQGKLCSILASCIQRLLQKDTPSVITEFDTLRTTLTKVTQTQKGPTKILKSRYQMLEAHIGTKVLTRKTDLDKRIEQLERRHLKEFGTLPCKSTNHLYSNLLKDKS